MVLSTAHVCRADGALLADSNQEWPLAGMLFGACGTLMHVRALWSHDAKYDQTLELFGFSEEFIELFGKIVDSGVDYVIFDGDGPRIPGLKTYDWDNPAPGSGRRVERPKSRSGRTLLTPEELDMRTIRKAESGN